MQRKIKSPGAFKTWRGLPTQLFLLVILPFAILSLAATLMSIGLHQNAMRTMVAERDVRAVVTAANFLENMIQSEQDIVNVLAIQSDAGMTLDAFVKEHNYSGKNLALFTPQSELKAFSGMEDVKLLLGGLNIKLSDIQVLKKAKNTFIVFSAGSNKGVRAVNIVPVEQLLRKVVGTDFIVGNESAAFLMNENREILARIGNQSWEGVPAQHPGVSEALQGQSGFTYMSTSSMEHVVAYSPVTPPGWALVIEEPWEAVDTPYLRLTQFAPLILIPLLAFTLVALWFGASQIVAPLQKLENRAAGLAWGDFTTIEDPVDGVEEIRQLQHELIHMAHKVQASQRSLHDYIGAITRGQEDERQRLARELHDETLQSLIALHQRIQLAKMKTTDDGVQKNLAEIESLSSNSIDELRRLTRALRPIYLEDFGLATALEMLAGESSKPGLEVNFTHSGMERRLDPAIELTLFRITQEAMSNVVRHAQATITQIKLDFPPAGVTLEIKDNGSGFTPPRSPAEFAPSGHFGLLGMHERAEIIRGKLSISSGADGTIIQVTVKI
jgi:signal transduction histidine kinase